MVDHAELLPESVADARPRMHTMTRTHQNTLLMLVSLLTEMDRFRTFGSPKGSIITVRPNYQSVIHVLTKSQLTAKLLNQSILNCSLVDSALFVRDQVVGGDLQRQLLGDVHLKHDNLEKTSSAGQKKSFVADQHPQKSTVDTNTNKYKNYVSRNQ